MGSSSYSTVVVVHEYVECFDTIAGQDRYCGGSLVRRSDSRLDAGQTNLLGLLRLQKRAEDLLDDENRLRRWTIDDSHRRCRSKQQSPSTLSLHLWNAVRDHVIEIGTSAVSLST